MARLRNFEDTPAWQMARELTREIYRLTNKGLFAKDYGLKDQVRRASSSIMLNIAEGFDGGSDKHFVQFLYHAIRSCSEVKSILYICLDNEYITETDFKRHYADAQSIRKQCFGLIRYLKT